MALNDKGHKAVVLLAEMTCNAVVASRKSRDGILGSLADFCAIHKENTIDALLAFACSDQFDIHNIILEK